MIHLTSVSSYDDAFYLTLSDGTLLSITEKGIVLEVPGIDLQIAPLDIEAGNSTMIFISHAAEKVG